VIFEQNCGNLKTRGNGISIWAPPLTGFSLSLRCLSTWEALSGVKHTLIVLGHLWHGHGWGIRALDGIAKRHVSGMSLADGKEPMLDFVSGWYSFGEDEE
jgi:hypothetical protein